MKRKISAYFKKRKFAFLIVFTALCAGAVAGAFSAVDAASGEVIANDLESGKDIIISSFAENVKFLGWIMLWGVNLFGFPVIIYLLYIKGASLSAALCALVIKDSSSGVVLVLSAVPYLACTIASVMILSQGGLSCSFGLLKSMTGRRVGKGIYENVITMLAEFVIATLIALLGGVCETLIKVNIV